MDIKYLPGDVKRYGLPLVAISLSARNVERMAAGAGSLHRLCNHNGEAIFLQIIVEENVKHYMARSRQVLEKLAKDPALQDNPQDEQDG